MEQSGGKLKVPFFSGTYYYTVDPKGRIIIPAPFREIISTHYNSTKLYITNAPFECCLHIYPSEEWNKLQEKVRNLPKSDEAVRFFSKKVIASAVEIEMDKQSRILIPASLRENARINTEVVIAGQTEIIELWGRDEWNKIVEISEKDKKAYQERLSVLGI